MPSLPVPYSASSTFSQPAVEDSDDDDMVFKRTRDDGVSKKNKLRTDSIRARLAAIPSRSAVDGKAQMQIKGRASSKASVSQRGESMQSAGVQMMSSSVREVSCCRYRSNSVL